MKGTELDRFEDRFGYPPAVFRVAVDALVVYVNKDNPIPGITLAELDAVFSKQRRRKHATPITKWKDVKIKGPLAQSTIGLYGRNAASGTYGFFKKLVLKNGDFKDVVKEQPGSASVVQGITKDITGIGYSGIGYKTSGVRGVPLAVSESKPFVKANYANVMNGSYPIWRHLYIYVNKAPNTPVSPLIAQFLTYLYSKDGQQIVVKDGYFPLSAPDVQEELNKLH
jgi:phosphate transport system substrate-binding protein